jgi:Domain of unknown function (DUF397)
MSSYSFSNGNCVECAWINSTFCAAGKCLQWRKSMYSHANGNCLEVVGNVLVRDSKLGDSSPVLAFTPDAWKVFVTFLKRL